MNWKDWFRKKDEEPEPEPDREADECLEELGMSSLPNIQGMIPSAMLQGMMGGMFSLDPQEPQKPVFVVPTWLRQMLDRVIERFGDQDLPTGWQIQAWQDADHYHVVLQGPTIGRGSSGEPISASHALEFDKVTVRDASDEVAEWTLYSALKEVFTEIEERGPFPPDFEGMS